MKFGRGFFENSDLDYPFDKALFAQKAQTQIYLGLPQWNVPEWKEIFYPADCPKNQFLKEYSERLDCVEVSSTFYAPVSVERVKQWCAQVPALFKFLPKWPRLITHDHFLKAPQKLISSFIEVAQSFENNLGTTLLQMPPTFSTDYKRELYQFLMNLPQDLKIAIEFRHPSWFDKHQLYDKLQDFFIKQKISSVCSDTPGARQAFHLSFTGENNIIRFLSDEDDEIDKKRLGLWRDFLSEQKQARDIYFIIHRPDNTYAPKLIPYFSDRTYPEKQLPLENHQQDFMSDYF